MVIKQVLNHLARVAIIAAATALVGPCAAPAADEGTTATSARSYTAEGYDVIVVDYTTDAEGDVSTGAPLWSDQWGVIRQARLTFDATSPPASGVDFYLRDETGAALWSKTNVTPADGDGGGVYDAITEGPADAVLIPVFGRSLFLEVDEGGNAKTGRIEFLVERKRTR